MSDTAPPSTEGAPPEGAPEEQTEPTVEDLAKELEALKKDSRKWEDRAKANSAAKKELDELRRAAMTDEERRTAELVEKDSALAEAITRAETAEAALARAEVAVEFSLSKEDAEALSGVTDPATLRALAARLAGAPADGGPKSTPAQGRRKTGAMSPRDAGIDALGALFGD